MRPVIFVGAQEVRSFVCLFVRLLDFMIYDPGFSVMSFFPTFRYCTQIFLPSI